MAAYGGLVSLSHTINQVLHPPPLYNFIIDTQQIESLQGKVSWMIDFLETYSSQEIADVETQIRDAAYEAEDLIESNVVDQIRATSAGNIPNLLCEGVDTVNAKFLSIEKELMEFKVKEDLQPKTSTIPSSTNLPLPGGNTTMVGLEDRINEIMEALATDEFNRQIVPIVGMGGIGKTTLAIAVYNKPFIVEHFHVRAWVTVSQEYTVRDLLLRLLSDINKEAPSNQARTDDEIGEILYKKLFGRRYLIVMDDVWDIPALDTVKRYLPCNNNGSRILVTTRVSNLTAANFESCTPYEMDFLDEDQSWDLLHKTIFGEEDCPLELEEVGKGIAKRCSGLPLALAVIGGLLAMSERTREHWESVAGDITSAFSYGNDEHVMKILTLSYIHLPIRLKPCFLYLAMFPEDSEIRVSKLVRLWVAEGLIRATQTKSLEEVAQEYLEDLINRNLIFVDKRGSSGKVKYCKIHDLLRDLCIVQAEKERFAYIAKLDNPNLSSKVGAKRRLNISSPSKPEEIAGIEAVKSVTLNLPWLHYGDGDCEEWTDDQIIYGFRLLKVFHVESNRIAHNDIVNLNNLRYYLTRFRVRSLLSMPLCWSLQTLEFYNNGEVITLPVEIWKMSQLRHLKIDSIGLHDPPDDQDMIALENLLTLKTVKYFKCTEQVLQRIPSLKKLRISYNFLYKAASEEYVGRYCLKNLICFEKLESLGIEDAWKLFTNMPLPFSLKKLALKRCNIPWEDLSNVGSLPNLEVLKLYIDATKGEDWNPIEGQFSKLKFLKMSSVKLKKWGAENFHFPYLERLHLSFAKDLEEIPASFADILTLEEIVLIEVRDSLRKSAKEISEQRKLLGYEPLQLGFTQMATGVEL